jgi:hypothetical protein
MSLERRLGVLVTLLLPACAVDTDGAVADAGALARNESALCRNALSPSQEQTVLKLIDDICGDTWCEGDNNFAFERLTCRAGTPASPDGGTCTLALRIIPREDDPPSYSRACTTPGFYGFDSLVETAQGGYQSLRWDYYLALSDCINALESALPR